MSLTSKKSIGAPAANAEEIVKVTFDMADELGTIADYDVIENTGTDGCIVEFLYSICETTVVGVGANIDLGKGDGGAEFLSDSDGPTMTAESFTYSATPGTKVELTNGEKIVMGIETAAITAGKFHMYFKISRKPF